MRIEACTFDSGSPDSPFMTMFNASPAVTDSDSNKAAAKVAAMATLAGDEKAGVTLALIGECQVDIVVRFAEAAAHPVARRDAEERIELAGPLQQVISVADVDAGQYVGADAEYAFLVA